MNDEMTGCGNVEDTSLPLRGSSSLDEPYTFVGDRWSQQQEGDGATITGTGCASDDEDYEGNPFVSPSATRGFFLTRMKTGECFELVGDPFYVGKSKDASYQLRNTETISRLHACFHVVGDECWIEDNRSLNGTVVNGTRLAPHCRVRVDEGFRIQLSEEDFVLETRVL